MFQSNMKMSSYNQPEAAKDPFDMSVISDKSKSVLSSTGPKLSNRDV